MKFKNTDQRNLKILIIQFTIVMNIYKDKSDFHYAFHHMKIQLFVAPRNNVSICVLNQISGPNNCYCIGLQTQRATNIFMF